VLGFPVLWINYFQAGKQSGKLARSKSTSIDLQKERKATARRGEKLPDLLKGTDTLSALMEVAAEHRWYKQQEHSRL